MSPIAAPTSNATKRRPWRRLAKAYWATTRVALSYVWLGIQRRFRSAEAYEVLVEKTHRENARRVEAAIIELQGLFIKVGQLISIMTNFLPEEFRKPLESLQDSVPPRPIDEIRARIERELRGYFRQLYERGALHGASLEEAFYVKCDAETNPPEVREQGKVVTEIGLAPALPAEFVVVRIVHGVGGVTIVGPSQP